MLPNGMISPKDLDLIQVSDDVDEIMGIIRESQTPRPDVR
jgi:predicted Rossmann-fold nucleotide-binding protein